MSLNTYPYNPFPASTDKLDEAHNAELQQEVDQLKEDVEKLETDKTETTVIAPEFDAETGVYAVGDLVMYQGKLYEFTTAHETAGDWDSTEVTEKTVADEIDTVKSGLTNATTVTNGNITAEEGVTITNYILQKCNKTVYLYMLVKFTPTLGTNQLLCVLPSGFRAPARMLFAGKNGTSGKFVTCETDNWGAVRVDPTSDDSSAVPTDYFLSVTYFTS